MHQNEINPDNDLVAVLIEQQFPKWKKLPLLKIKHDGTDHAIFRLGDHMCVRLPRIESSAKFLLQEQHILKSLKPHLPCKIPSPIVIGKPCAHFPYSWAIMDWIEGHTAFNHPPKNLEQCADTLANIILSLQKIETADAPYSQRGGILRMRDQYVWSSLDALKHRPDHEQLCNLWNELTKTPPWDETPCWIHGDLLPGNILLQGDHIAAIIDFGLAGIGDPACDLLPAWSLLDKPSRSIFRERLKTDKDSWNRGKGWALSQAIIILPYYEHTNPELVSIANRMIDALMAEID